LLVELTDQPSLLYWLVKHAAHPSLAIGLLFERIGECSMLRKGCTGLANKP